MSILFEKIFSSDLVLFKAFFEKVVGHAKYLSLGFINFKVLGRLFYWINYQIYNESVHFDAKTGTRNKRILNASIFNVLQGKLCLRQISIELTTQDNLKNILTKN